MIHNVIEISVISKSDDIYYFSHFPIVLHFPRFPIPGDLVQTYMDSLYIFKDINDIKYIDSLGDNLSKYAKMFIAAS